MKILLTGAFGNIGEQTLTILLTQDHEITCFDIKTSKNQKKAKQLLKLGNFNTLWGDITKIDDVNNAVSDNESIIHLAAIIPPGSEKNNELTRRINVDGTKNVVDAIKNANPQPRFIFTSSISIHGPRMSSPPPRKADEIPKPTDNYTHSKVDCEKLIKESGIPWVIFRLGAAPPLEMSMDAATVLFDIPLEQRIEYVNSKDVGLAVVNAITADALHKVLLIGGGKTCQMTYKDFVKGALEAYGIAMPSEIAFKIPKDDNDWYYTDWMDTEESQALLKYQHTTYEDLLIDVKENLGAKRGFFRLLNPVIKWYLERKSPYKEENLKNISD